MALFPTNATQIQTFATALYGVQVGSTTLAQVNNDILSSGGLNNALNAYYTASFGTATTASVAQTIATNVGLGTDTNAVAFITAQLNAAAPAARGAAVIAMLDNFLNTTTGTYASAAAAFNTTVATAVAYTGAANVVAGTANPVAPGAFTLTTSPDSLTGTSVNDTFTGTLTYTHGATAVDATSQLTVADQIAGAGGSDVFNVIVNTETGVAPNGSTTFPLAAVTGVQAFNIRNISGATNSIDASKFSGLTTVNSDRGTSTLTITNLPSGGVAGLIGNGGIANGDLNAGFKSTATSGIVSVQNGTKQGTITTSGTVLATNTVNSSGAANTLTALTLGAAVTALNINATTDITTGAITNTTADALKTITITGAGAVDISGGATNSTTTTVDASASTGTVTVALGTAITQYKGSAGSDKVTTATLTATTAGEIDGGAGSNTLNVAAAADISSATKGAEFVNFQNLANGAGVANMDIQYVSGVTAYKLTATGSGFDNLPSTATVSISATDDTFDLKALSGTTGTLNVDLTNTGSTAASTVISATTLSTSGYKTLNLAVNSGISTAITDAAATGADQLSFAASTNLKSLIVTGAYDVGIDASTNATGLTTIDVSAMTAGAAIKLPNNTAALTVTGTSSADYITLGAPSAGIAVNVSAGAGNDTIVGTLAKVTAATIDAGSGTDTLIITDTTGVGSVGDNSFSGLTNFEKLTLKATAAINLTSGGFFNQAFGTGGITLAAADLNTGTASDAVTIDLSLYRGTVKDTITDVTTTGNLTVKGSSSAANDLTVTASVATTATITVNGGSSNDKFTITSHGGLTTGGVVVTTGGGIDTVILDVTQSTPTAATAATVIVGTNSPTSGSTYDTITGFTVGGGATRYSDKLTLDGSASLNAGISSTAVSGNTATQLAFAVDANGMLTFTGTALTGLSTASKDALAISSYNSTIANLLSAHNVIAYDDGTNTFVFQHNATTDSVVELVGVTGVTHVTATAATATSHYLVVA